ncbi:MAG TPA: hypothetical protein VHV83_03720 [Armatimonadota bacterium]|nr:hypothetical protein [Armatimonadota bacterium]
MKRHRTSCLNECPGLADQRMPPFAIMSIFGASGPHWPMPGRWSTISQRSDAAPPLKLLAVREAK